MERRRKGCNRTVAATVEDFGVGEGEGKSEKIEKMKKRGCAGQGKGWERANRPYLEKACFIHDFFAHKLIRWRHWGGDRRNGDGADSDNL